MSMKKVYLVTLEVDYEGTVSIRVFEDKQDAVTAADSYNATSRRTEHWYVEEHDVIPSSHTKEK